MDLFAENKPFLVMGLPQFTNILFPSEVIEVGAVILIELLFLCSGT